MTHIHRTPEMKARRVAAMVKSPDELRQLLEQFPREHRAGIEERLRPHLTFAADGPGTVAENGDPAESL